MYACSYLSCWICSDLWLCEDQTIGTLHPKVLSFALPQSSPQPGPKLHSWFRADGVYEGSSQEGPQRDPVKSGATHGFEVLPFLRTHVFMILNFGEYDVDGAAASL